MSEKIFEVGEKLKKFGKNFLSWKICSAAWCDWCGPGIMKGTAV